LLTWKSSSSDPLIDELVSSIHELPSRPPVCAFKVDLSADPISASKSLLSTLDSWLGPSASVHILVNNAGCEVVAPLGEISLGDYEKVYNLNVRAPLFLTQALLPRFDPDENNRIINIGSVASRAGFSGLGLYCSSKAALEGLTRCWARELGKDGTTVNQVNPGPVDTKMLEDIPAEIVDLQKRLTPVQNRVGTVEEIARIVAWLASDEASWVSGQVISASGGWAMY